MPTRHCGHPTGLQIPNPKGAHMNRKRHEDNWEKIRFFLVNFFIVVIEIIGYSIIVVSMAQKFLSMF